ncbi:hypothetical protein KI387_028217, partial [Taxus chinensis]
MPQGNLVKRNNLKGLRALDSLHLAAMELNESETENASKKSDEILSAELDEETCVRIRKKSRRVSFADITSVHVFDRDEDFETPPDDKPNARENTVSTPPHGSPRPHPKNLRDKDTGQHLQLTPSSIQKKDSQDSVPEAGSPGSVSDKGTPDEDREFFGPVSLWHIAAGMNGLSPVSDDITLDCTTFSLQFGKLICPDKQRSDHTEGVKTPVLETEGRTLVTEDLKTPVEQIGQPSKENAMSLTQPKKPITCPAVLDDKTLDSCERMNVMSLIEEKQFNYDFASLSPDLDSMLAEKMSQIQTGISVTELNQGEEHFGSCSRSESASRKTEQGMEFKDSAGEEVKMSSTESIAAIKQDDAKLSPDHKRNQFTIENMSTMHNKNTALTTEMDLSVYCFDEENQQQQQRSARFLSPELKGEAKNLADKEVDRCWIDVFVTEHVKDTKVISDVEIKQSIIETVGVKDNKDTKLMEGEKFSSIKFEAEQQHKQTGRLSDTEVGLEPKTFDDLEIQGSTIEIMANKHCNDSRFTTTEEGNQSMIKTATEDCKTDSKLTTGNGTSLLNFEGDQSREKEKEMTPLNLRQETGLMSLSEVELETSNINIMVTDNNAFEFTPDVESNQSMVEIAETKCEKDNNVRLSDDSNLHECEEQQQHQCQKKRLVNMGWDMVLNHVNMDFEMSATEVVGAKHHHVTEANQDAEMIFSINTIEANNCYKDIRTKPAYDSSLSIFDGQQQKQERKSLIDPGSGSVQKDLAVVEEASATASTATNRTNLTTDAGINLSTLEIVSTKNALPSLSNLKDEQHEEHEERLLNLKLGVNLHDVDRVETERTSNCIMTFKERNDKKLTPNSEMNQSATKTLTASDNFPYKFEGGHFQEEHQSISSNLAQDMQAKDPVIVEVETSAIEVMATKQITDTRLASGGDLNPSLEIMAIKHNKDARFPRCDHSSDPSYNGKDETQQELMLMSDCEMHPQNYVNMERERSMILISTTEQNDLIELTHNIGTIHSRGIVAAKGKGDSKIVPDVKMNQSLAELHEKDDFALSNFITHLNPKEEHQQQKQQIFISSEGVNIYGESKLSEDQPIGNFKEAGSISEPIKLKTTTPRKKNQQKSASSVDDVALIGTCGSLENVHSEGSIELFPKLDGTAGRSGTVSVKDFFCVFPVSTGDTQQVCKYVDPAQLEVSSSAPSQPLMKHSIPESKTCHSKSNTISDSSVTPLKKPTELENVLKYPFTPDENLEDSKSKEKKKSSSSSAYLTKLLLRSMGSKEGHGIPNNGVCTPKESSGNILEVNLIPSSQIIESNFSTSGIDQCKNSSLKNKLSKNQNTKHFNTPLNDTTASASHFMFPTQLISCDMKSTTEYKLYDLQQNMSPVHKDASLFGMKHHVLVGNSERDLLCSVQPILSPTKRITPSGLLDDPCSLTNVKKSNFLSEIRNEAKGCGTSSNDLRPILAPNRGTMHELTRSGSLDDSGSLTNVKKSNFLSEIRNDAEGCGTSSNAFSTPVNAVSCGDANYSHAHCKSIEHLNLCHETHQIDVQNSFQERVRDAHGGTHVYSEHRVTPNLMDIRTLNTLSINNDFSRTSHSKLNIQGKRQEEFFFQQAPAYSTPRNANNFSQTGAGIILGNANDSVCKKSHPMKLNTVYSSTKSKNGEEACCLLAQDIKTQSNHENVSLPYSENECNSTQQKKLSWKNLEKNQLPNYTSGTLSQGSIMLQHARGDSCIKTYEFSYVSEKTLPTQACDDEENHGKKRKSRVMDAQERSGLIKDYVNNSLNCRIKPAESVHSGRFYLESSEGRIHSSKKPFITRIEPTADVMAMESGKLINVSDKFCQGGEELHIPLIFKPKTLEEWLIFLFLSQPQLGLLQVKLKMLREDMDSMKFSNNQQFQALDVKKCPQMENKYLTKQQSSVGSVKWLQQVVAHEKSKLLLLQAKKHELMRAAQELHSGCQESDKLKSFYLQTKGQFGGPVNTATAREDKVAYVHSLEAEIEKQ